MTVQDSVIQKRKAGPPDDPVGASLNEPAAVECVVASKTGLHLRVAPSLDGAILAILPFGSGVFMADSAAEADEEWVMVRTGWLKGWVMACHLCPLTAQAVQDGAE